MNLGRNLSAAVLGTTWAALIGFLVVPIYVKYLGIENYGLIGFFAITQAMLQLLDMGLATTLNREVARCAATGQMDEGRRLMHSLAVVYWATAALLGLLVFILAPLIVGIWLSPKQLELTAMTNAVQLMGVVIACRWPIGLYQGALMGMQRLVVSSGISAAMVTIANLGAVAVLSWWSRTIEAFFMWQAAIAFIHVLLMRHAAWKILGHGSQATSFDFGLLKKIWRFSAGVSAIAIASVLLTQLDKILLSRMLALDEFGKYVLAGALASSLYVLLTPTFNVLYPKMSALIAKGEESELLGLYKNGTRVFVSLLFPIAIAVAFYSRDVVMVWTGSEELALSVGPLVSLLILGTACNGVMHFPYALQLAHGRARLALSITLMLVVAIVPLLIFLTLRYGAIGGAAAWLTVNVSYVLLGTWMTHRVLLPDEGSRWLIEDVGQPLLLSLLITWTGWRIFRSDGEPILNLVAATITGLVAIAANGRFVARKALAGLRS